MICIKCKANIPEEFAFCPYCGKKQVKTSAPKPMKRPNGHGTVYKLSGRRRRPWVAAMGKSVIGYYQERSEALAALESLGAGGIPSRYNDTIEDVYIRWKETHFRDLTPKGREMYEHAWSRLASIKSSKMRLVKTIDFQKIIDDAKRTGNSEKPLSRSSKEKIKQLCSQLCKQAMQDDIINKNYAQFVKLEKEFSKERPIFTASDIEKLFKDQSQTAKIILVLIYTGLRINELFTMRSENVHLEAGYMVGGEKTQAGKNRIVPINAKIRAFIMDWYSQGNELLLANRAGHVFDAASFRSQKYYPLLDKLEIERKSPHCTRHTFASLMSKAGVKPENLQKIIGHADFSTTANVYIHADIQELVEEVSKI